MNEKGPTNAKTTYDEPLRGAQRMHALKEEERQRKRRKRQDVRKSQVKKNTIFTMEKNSAILFVGTKEIIE